LPLTTQARLLRVLESGEFLKVGSSQVQKTNIRVVAATNEDMRRAVAERRFREDLYYRLSTVQISVPPLRDRGSDILLLARKFAVDFAERYRTAPVEFSEGAREALLRYRWPGNVRQLKNVVEQMSVFEAGNTVGREMLETYLPQSAGSYAPVPVGRRAESRREDAGASEPHSYSSEREMLLNLILRLQREIEELREEVRSHHPVAKAEPLAIPQTALVRYRPAVSDLRSEPVRETPAAAEAMTLEQTERETIRQSLERNQGRRKATAAELNISERTLYRKIKEYGLE
ncbi:MAG: sigma 54-interacting transcriptional regulator, partial [Muribaculaceae bacterium]|nr:sigma 54-interacting transcriptional regulator [Muribaculaceae bacterium]